MRFPGALSSSQALSALFRFFRSKGGFFALSVIFTVTISLRAGERTIEIKFRPVAGASAYEIQWLKSPAEKNDSDDGEIERVSASPVRRNLGPDILYFRIRSLDARGIPGGWSSPAHVPAFEVKSRHVFTPVRVGSEERNYYAGESIGLTARDGGSGVSSLYWSLGEGDFMAYTTPLRLPPEGHIVLRYYSEDRAGNRENIRQMEFWTDRVAPITRVQFESPSVERNGRRYSSGKIVLSVTALDGGSGVERTFCKIIRGTQIEEKEDCSRIEIDFSGGPSVIFEYYSKDRMGNAEKPRRIYFVKPGDGNSA